MNEDVKIKILKDNNKLRKENELYRKGFSLACARLAYICNVEGCKYGKNIEYGDYYEYMYESILEEIRINESKI